MNNVTTGIVILIMGFFVFIFGFSMARISTELRLKDNAIKCNEAQYHPQTGQLIFSDNAMMFLEGVIDSYAIEKL